MKRQDAFPSRYLSQDDLPEAPTTMRVIIVDVLPETMPGDASEEKPVMHFQGDVKPMIVNNTNWLTIEDMYGTESDDWRGKPIDLYIDRSITFAGKRTGGIRVRPGMNTAPVSPAPNPHAPYVPEAANTDTLNPGIVWTKPQAIIAAKEVGITEDDIRQALQRAGYDRWKAARDSGMVMVMIADKKAADAEARGGDLPEDSIPF